jgi:acetylornithine aminotransferase/acetylornithine/N-succinyldiaminopimelate aminotransferase
MSALQTVSTSAMLPVSLVRGEGARIWDEDDQPYWDFYGGHAVALLGQGHPRWVAAIAEQAATLSFVTTIAPTPVRDQAIAALCRFTGMDQAFLVNSGAEANEAALKVARKATGRSVVVAMEAGFHGRTMACLGVTHAGHYRTDHAPVHGSVRFVPYGDLDALQAAMGSDVAAVLIEPIQGIAGVIPAPEGFLQGARKLCDTHGAKLILDEIQTGMGRTGRPLASHGSPAAAPDLVTVGKSLGAGFPVAALLLTEAMAATTQPGEHGSTFGSGPMACAAVHATIATIIDEGLLDRARAIEADIRSRQLPGVVAIRGAGCLLGLILDRPARPVASALLSQGILAGTANDARCLRLCPPAVLPTAGIDALEQAMHTVCG